MDNSKVVEKAKKYNGAQLGLHLKFFVFLKEYSCPDLPHLSSLI